MQNQSRFRPRKQFTMLSPSSIAINLDVYFSADPELFKLRAELIWGANQSLYIAMQKELSA